MADGIFSRLRNAWNVFVGNEAYSLYRPRVGIGYGYRPDMFQFALGTEQSIVAPLYNRIGIDVASMRYNHVRLDENLQFKEIIPSSLNECLSVEANLDQSSRQFIQDVAMSLCDEGVIAIVPIDTTSNPNTGSYDILTMRTGKIRQWYPEHVQVHLYNQRTGLFEDIVVPKVTVAIVENPLYAVMNEPNGTLKRLIEKLNLIDLVDRSGAGKLDLIVQLPYVIKSAARQEQAENRRKQILDQLKDSEYGIAYTDGTEQITQLNRPAENNLMAQVEYLTRTLYSQLGLSEAVFNGTADEVELLNYFNRTIEPISSAIADAMHRSFITRTGRTQRQAIRAIRDPFRYISPKDLPEFTDKFTRNEVLSSNEVRSIVGWYPSKDPKANELRNKNLNQQDEKANSGESGKDNQNGSKNGRSIIEDVKVKA